MHPQQKNQGHSNYALDFFVAFVYSPILKIQFETASFLYRNMRVDIAEVAVVDNLADIAVFGIGFFMIPFG